jgi:NitT/TauT family transport system ATP-binding protein
MGLADIAALGVYKSYGGQAVLKNFTASFSGGRTTCLMGDSGLGKTTLLRIFMGLVPADSGEIRGVRGRRVSAVFQEDRLLESFNALTNVGFAAAKGVAPEEIIADLGALGLQDSLRKPASQLSGGMRRRVAIVRAVLAQGDVVFLDEPLKGLDAQTREQTAEYLKNRLQGKTVVMVTHNLDEVKLMGGRLFLMGREGEIREHS